MTDDEFKKLDRALTRGIKRSRKASEVPGISPEAKIRHLKAAQSMSKARSSHRHEARK